MPVTMEAPRRPGDQVRHQATLLRKLAAGEDDRLRNAGGRAQHRLDLRDLDTMPPHLDLEVLASGVDQAAVRLHHAEIAGQIKPTISPVRVRQERLAG